MWRETLGDDSWTDKGEGLISVEQARLQGLQAAGRGKLAKGREILVRNAYGASGDGFCETGKNLCCP